LSAIGQVEHDVLIVDENMLFDVETKLEDYFKNNSFDKVYVNVTGGTKIMSLAAYSFFKDKLFVKNIIYFPIGSTSYKQIYPLGKYGKASNVLISHKMSVEEYLMSLGLKIESIGKPEDIVLSSKLYDMFFEKRCIFEELTSILRRYRKKDGNKELSKSDDLKKVKCLIGFLDVDPDDFDFTKSRKWIDYFSGGWFEEYVYSEIGKLKGDCIDDIQINLKLQTKTEYSEVPNEFDVIFIKNNNLNIVECKSGNLENYEMTNTFYKVAYLNRNFGLSASSYIVSLGDNVFDKNSGELKKGIKDKSKVFGVGFVNINDVKNGIKEYFENRLCK
jgi:hypothetical protein